MPRSVVPRRSVVASWTIAILCSPLVDTAARAQTADAFNPGANQVVATIAVQPDGKILVAGGFTGLGGGSGTTTRNHIGRLNADGTLDPDLQSWRERSDPRRCRAAGRKDPDRRQLHLGRRRHRPHDACAAASRG